MIGCGTERFRIHNIDSTCEDCWWIQEALELLQQHQDQLGDSPAYLWRLCKARYLLAVIAGQVRRLSSRDYTPGPAGGQPRLPLSTLQGSLPSGCHCWSGKEAF
jgi:hypothetical protein